jgi:hypothetical protein
MQREDLVVKFGALRHPQPNLQALAAVVAENENVRPCLLHDTLSHILMYVRRFYRRLSVCSYDGLGPMVSSL